MLQQCRYGAQRLCFLHTRSAFLYSTSSSLKEATLSLSDYLVECIGLSRDEANSAALKVGRLKSKENAESVINFFSEVILEQTQVHRLLNSVPRLLNSDVEKTLKPKIRVFMDLGLSGSDLVQLLASEPSILARGLESQLLPNIDFLKSILGSNEDVVKTIRKLSWVLTGSNHENMRANFALLESYGLSNERIRKLVSRHPRCLVYKTKWLRECLAIVEEMWGVSRKSSMFECAVHVVSTFNKEALQSKYEVFKSCGWSESDVFALARKQPWALRLSEDSLRSKLKFFMKELGYEPGYIIRHGRLITYSMEKRVVPRNTVLQVLKEQNLINSKVTLCGVIGLAEVRFLDEFILPYKDVLPQLYGSYTVNKMGCLEEASRCITTPQRGQASSHT